MKSSLKALAVLAAVLFLSAGCKSITNNFLDMPKPESKKLIIQKDVMVQMRDGIKLATDIYRPKVGSKFPTILIRIPYGKGTMDVPAKIFSRQGYVCVVQDCRGTSASEGDIFFPVFWEYQDGKDTVDWIAKQPWFDGNLGAWGASYFGITTWNDAPDNPYLKAFYPILTSGNLTKVTYVGGAIQYEIAAGWTSSVGHQAGTNPLPNNDYKIPANGLYNQPIEAPAFDIGRFARNIDNPNIFEEMLHVKLPPDLNPKKPPRELVNAMNAKFIELYNHPKLILSHDEWTFDDNYKRISAPALSLAGWYDIFAPAQLDEYNRLIKEGQGNAKQSRLVVGPWVHGRPNTFISKGDESVGWKGMLREYTRIEWFDRWLKGKNDSTADTPPIRIYVMGANKWRYENEWPLARTKYTKYYLHSGGNAGTDIQCGSVDTDPPQSEEPVDSFDFDPSNPVPTTGGSNLLTQVGPAFQNKVEQRPDVLSYTSAELDADLEVTGPITMTLYASSSAIDTDFTAKLSDVMPNGKAFNIQDGIIRVRFRNSLTQPSLIEPDKVYEYTIDLWVTSYVFKKGHRIRVDVSSSNFPRFEINSNMGGFGGPGAYKIAHQTVFHNPEHPSYITLPVIPAE